MVRETFTITPVVRHHLRRRGVTVEPLDAKLTTDDYFAFWRDVAARNDRPDLGLSIGSAIFGRSVSSVVALQAMTLGDALRTFGRYKRLVCPEDVVLDVDEREAGVRFDWVLASGEVPDLLIDAVFASLTALVARATGNEVAPIRIELARRSRHVDVLRAHFRCPVVFGRAHDRIVFAASALATPLVTANRHAFHQLLPRLEAQLVGKRSVLGEVRIAIARTLSAGSRPSVQSVSRRIDTTPRTLQRRLAQARTSFQREIDDVRRISARRLLAETELDPVDISFLLGFEEPNSFVRAFRSWEGMTPIRWRASRA